MNDDYYSSLHASALIDWIFCLQHSALVIKVQQKVFDWVHGHSLSMIQDKNSDHSTTIPISIQGEWVHLLLAQAILYNI